MWLIFFSVISLVASQNVYGFTREDPIVVTNVGKIRGVRADDGNYTKYMGIPFAMVNESNIFGASIPHPPFEGIFEANDDSIRCPQLENFNNTLDGSLDCLRVNVYVPDSANPTNRLPVMAWIFGGRFEIGFYGLFMFGPQYLVRHDVILVTINYRLGPYGFMCLDIPEVPGNQGLKDQAIGLRWIKDKIESFGGDPDRITIFGNSAGAMSIGLHLVSNDEIMYNSAILQSGSSIFPTLIRNNDPNVPVKLANQLGFITSDIHEALLFLSTADVHEVVNAGIVANIEFRPCVEKEFPGVESFLNDHPVNLKQTKTEGMAILQGYSSKEALFEINMAGANAYHPLIFYSYLNNCFTFDSNTREELEPIVRRFYIGDEDISENVKWEIIDFMSDASFVYSSVRTIAKFLESGAKKIYHYVLSYDGSRNYSKIKGNISYPGATHADELGYLFHMLYDQMPEPNIQDQLIIDRMTTMWTNFAKYGDPTPETTALLPDKWEPITTKSPYYYLEINTQMTAGKRHFHKRMAFWDLFFKSFEQYQVGYRDVNEEDSSTDASCSVFLNPILGIGIILNGLARVV